MYPFFLRRRRIVHCVCLSCTYSTTMPLRVSLLRTQAIPIQGRRPLERRWKIGVPPPEKYHHYFTWDPVKGKWEDILDSKRTEQNEAHTETTLRQNKLNWPTAAPNIKIPVYAFNVSYNAGRDELDRLKGILQIPPYLDILDSPPDDLQEAYGGTRPTNFGLHPVWPGRSKPHGKTPHHGVSTTEAPKI